MSEFKIACPGCDQHIACDESYSGRHINCPTCARPILVPVFELPVGGESVSKMPVNTPAGSGLRIAHTAPASVAPRSPQPARAAGRTPVPSNPENNAWLVTWLLSFFLGGFGVDRFYNGRTGLGIGKLLSTILTGGAIGLIWAWIDIILLLAGKYRDARGNLLKRPKGRYATLQGIGIVLAGLFGLVCLLNVLFIGALAIALITQPNFGSGPSNMTLYGSTMGESTAAGSLPEAAQGQNWRTVQARGITYIVPLDFHSSSESDWGFDCRGMTFALSERNGQLTVDGLPYGSVKTGDTVSVANKGTVLVNDTPRQPER